jgi:predicted acetyltransferase
MELVQPSAAYKDSFIEAVQAFKEDGEYARSDQWFKRISLPELENDFDSFVARETSHERGENLPPGYISCTEYWLVDSGEFIGRINIRHTLTESLRRIGGHIGYAIRPDRRGRGYGSAILALALPKAKSLGLERVLVTCDEQNVASKKIIEKNGGKLENQVQDQTTGATKLRYWIATA